MFKCDESSSSSGLSFQGKPPVLSNSYNIYVRFATNSYHPINYYGNWLCLPMEYYKLRLKQAVTIIADVTREWEESENNNKPKHQVPADPADVWKFY